VHSTPTIETYTLLLYRILHHNYAEKLGLAYLCLNLSSNKVCVGYSTTKTSLLLGKSCVDTSAHY